MQWFVDSVAVAAPSTREEEDLTKGSRDFSPMNPEDVGWSEPGRDQSSDRKLMLFAAIGVIVVICVILLALAGR